MYVAVEPERKFVPLIVNVCVAAPAVTEAGERLVMLGMGFVVVVVELPPPQAVVRTTLARMQITARRRKIGRALLMFTPPETQDLSAAQ